MSVGEQMNAVGHHLQKRAVEAELGDKDAFARSAFNRYYYSAYLTIREMLGSLDANWSSLPHASYPQVLNGKILRKLRDARKRAAKNKDNILVGRIENAIRSVKELAKIITIAYGIRVIADYEPEEQVSFDGSPRFAIRSIDISDAHDWGAKARTLCLNVEKVWDEIHG